MATIAVIVLSVFGELLLLVGVFYFYVVYCWDEERPIGTGVAYKIIVVES